MQSASARASRVGSADSAGVPDTIVAFCQSGKSETSHALPPSEVSGPYKFETIVRSRGVKILQHITLPASLVPSNEANNGATASSIGVHLIVPNVPNVAHSILIPILQRALKNLVGQLQVGGCPELPITLPEDWVNQAGVHEAAAPMQPAQTANDTISPAIKSAATKRKRSTGNHAITHKRAKARAQDLSSAGNDSDNDAEADDEDEDSDATI